MKTHAVAVFAVPFILDGKGSSLLTMSNSYLENPLARRPGRPPSLLILDSGSVDEFLFQCEVINSNTP